MEEGQFVEGGPVQCIKCGGDSFICGKSLSCLSGWAWPRPSACASSCVFTKLLLFISTTVEQQSFVLSGISDCSELLSVGVFHVICPSESKPFLMSIFKSLS